MNITQITSIYNEQSDQPIKKWHKSKAALQAQIEGFTTAQVARAYKINPKVAREKVRRYSKQHQVPVCHEWNWTNLNNLEAALGV